MSDTEWTVLEPSYFEYLQDYITKLERRVAELEEHHKWHHELNAAIDNDVALMYDNLRRRALEQRNV